MTIDNTESEYHKDIPGIDNDYISYCTKCGKELSLICYRGSDKYIDEDCNYWGHLFNFECQECSIKGQMVIIKTDPKSENQIIHK